MGLGDLGNVVIILLIFMFLHLIIALSIGISTIKNNWDEYKCNPAVMPFADIFGHDTRENYEECVKSVQIDFMSSFLDPIFGSLEIFASMGNSFLETFEDIKLFGLSVDGSIGEVFNTMTNKIKNMGNELSRMYIVIIDTFGNLFSIFTVIFYMGQGGIITAETVFTKNLTGALIAQARDGADDQLPETDAGSAEASGATPP